MDLNGMIEGLLKEKAIEAISKKTGLNIDSSKGLAAKALPMILGALKNNSKDSNKKESLEKAVSNNDGSILDNFDNIDLEDGSKILGHIFGDKKADVEKQIGDKSVLSVLAPMVMGALGKANSDSGSSAGDLLASDGIAMKLATTFLDKDGDGDIKDDLLGMAMGFISGKK